MNRKTRVPVGTAIILLALSVWIILVVTVPRLAITDIPAVYSMTRQTLKHVAKRELSSSAAVRAYLDRKNLWQVASDEHHYYTLDVSGSEEKWIITATPGRTEAYTRSIPKRFLLLDFSKYHFPILRIDNESCKIEEGPP